MIYFPYYSSLILITEKKKLFAAGFNLALLIFDSLFFDNNANKVNGRKFNDLAFYNLKKQII